MPLTRPRIGSPKIFLARHIVASLLLYCLLDTRIFFHFCTRHVLENAAGSLAAMACEA